uniref:Rab-GAP TBC domain-containing protein n=1 Tax=Melopsittacus undulatus TaxID=13146 RepID=A0A8V5GUQ6_MELUD
MRLRGAVPGPPPPPPPPPAMAAPGGGAALEEECDVVRVRVKKNEGLQPPEFRSFAVDPQITSLDVLQHILVRAFDLQGRKSFSISFAARDPQGQESFVPLLSDGDLAAAFACARPALRLRLDVRPPAESPLLEDWDIISPREVAAVEPLPERRSLLAAALPFTQALLAQVGRTLARAQAALAWPEGSPPDADLRTYLGPGGRLLRPQDLRLHVYHGGVEPGLRKVVWRYLLNVFPPGLSGQERLAHLRRKADEYAALKAALAAQAAPAELALVAAAVRKDVVRTDRGHPYFCGPEEGHPHLAALQALLTTFALGHPRLSYCQGMSDVAAPLLAVLDDEAQAFLCFCSLMRRLGPRFRPGGRGLARAFAHLRRLLRRTDPPFWAFLAARGAHDLLFCYRWLLLELKREFAFEDALRVLEITWSSLPPAPPPPPEGVPLLGAPLGPHHRGLRERRGLRPRAALGVAVGSSRCLGMAKLVLTSRAGAAPVMPILVPRALGSSRLVLMAPGVSKSIPKPPVMGAGMPVPPGPWGRPKSQMPLSRDEVGVEDDGSPLPPPEELGQGNPFLLFLCLAMLLEQREALMARAGDYNEVAMHFDRLLRRHHLPRVLHRAKGLFARYLEGWGGAPPGGAQGMG